MQIGDGQVLSKPAFLPPQAADFGRKNNAQGCWKIWFLIMNCLLIALVALIFEMGVKKEENGFSNREGDHKWVIIHTAVILAISIPALCAQHEDGMLYTCSPILPFNKMPKMKKFVMSWFVFYLIQCIKNNFSFNYYIIKWEGKDDKGVSCYLFIHVLIHSFIRQGLAYYKLF